MENLLEQLNESQREAVMCTEGPVMIIAGAGSGKTRVLTYRIAYLLSKGIDAFSILALTFTNKAAREMRLRIEKLAGPEARNLWMGTFHSVFARILRAEASKLGFTSDFTIYDTDDSKSLLRTIIKEAALDDKVYKPASVLGRISAAKNSLVSVEQYLADPLYRIDDESSGRPELGKLYKTYRDRCFKANAMDFDDLLFNTNILFEQHPDVLNKYQHRFRYVMVDEFQDTNISQYLITKRLAARQQNICVVGDDAQSIYAFRGADIRNILNFEKDYPELKVFKLEQNYRSTDNIVKAANSLIIKNKAQLQKEVWTANPAGELLYVLRANTDNEEGRLIASSIFEEKMKRQLRYGDFAVLYRTNAQSRAIEEALRRMNIRYRVYGGLSFYQRKEIKDVVAYMRFTLNHNDEEAFRRIINLPRRGIGDTTIARIVVAAEEHGIAVWEVLENATKFIAGKPGMLIEEFSVLIKSFERTARSKDAFTAASSIARESGLLRELYEDKTVEGLARYENVQELLNGVKEFVADPANEDKSLSAYLQNIALLTDADREEDDNRDHVALMTIHSAKGLEFKDVYITGMEEDLFPSQMMLGSRAELEEERRLFYVAITRAQERLTLSHASTRYRFGQLKVCEPSRFLDEIEPEYIKHQAKAMESAVQFTRDSGVRYSKNLFTPPSKPKFYTPPADFKPDDTRHLIVGMRVEHPKFGYGVVKSVDVSGSDRKATVSFEEFGEKTLLLSFAKLKIHEN